MSTPKVKKIFAGVFLLFLGSLHAADNETLQIVTLDNTGKTETIDVPQHIAKQCHVLNTLCTDNTIDLRISANHQNFLLYEPLKHVFDAMERNPSNNIDIYQQYLTSIDPEDVASLWKCLDYLIGPVEFRIAASNYLIDNDRCKEVGEISLKATVRSLQDALSASQQVNLSKQRITHINPITGLDGNPVQWRTQGDTVDLSHNLLTEWDNESSNAIMNLAPDIQRLDLSHNIIQRIPAHSFHGLPRNTHVSMQSNSFDDQTISDQAFTGGRNLTINLQRNNISPQKISTLRQLALRMGLLTRIKQRILQNRYYVHGIINILSAIGYLYSHAYIGTRVLGQRAFFPALLFIISGVFGFAGLAGFLDSPAMRNGNWVTNIVAPWQANTITSDYDDDDGFN